VRYRTYFNFLAVYSFDNFSVSAALPSLDEERREVVMATTHFSQPAPHGSPYCSDPNSQSCKELREVQEAIRLHQPVPGQEISLTSA